MNVKTELGKIIKQYCLDFQKFQDKTLARKIAIEKADYKKEGETDEQYIERLRSSVRAYRGHKGQHHRDRLDPEAFTPLTFDTTYRKPFKNAINTGAKVLIIDIETAPLLSYTWGIWQQNISLNAIESDWFCLTYAAKWLFDEKVYHGRLTGAEALRQDDSRIIKSIWGLLNEADIVIAHNGAKFDLPKLNTRFIIHKMHPPLPYQTIDTLQVVKKQFSFTSNKLDYVNQMLSLPRKIENEGMPLWIKCYKGDNKALKTMLDYNIWDVKILEDFYLRIRAWIKPHPNMGLFILDETQHTCPTCGSADLRAEGKLYRTTANNYEQFRCCNCGATGRKRLANVTLKQRRHLTLSVPK